MFIIEDCYRRCPRQSWPTPVYRSQTKFGSGVKLGSSQTGGFHLESDCQNVVGSAHVDKCEEAVDAC